jgi:glutaredoxin
METTKSNPKNEIIVYGSKNCIHCIKFLSSLDSAGIKYKFRDVEQDKNLFNEMYQKIQKANIKGFISYPVLDIEGKILVNPDFKQFTGFLN